MNLPDDNTKRNTFGRMLNLEGQRFGRLTVIRRNPRQGRNSYWDCQCDCGRIFTTGRPNLIQGTTQSCGCLRRELQTQRNRARMTTHGNSRHPMHIRWKAILRRTTNPEDANYPRYGGRGITIDSAWLDFDAFYRDMGNPPSSDHSIERKDNDGPYSKDNCCWATKKEQALNRRSNRNVTAFGRTQTISEWALETGLHFNCIDKRLMRNWTPERAVSTKSRRSAK